MWSVSSTAAAAAATAATCPPPPQNHTHTRSLFSEPTLLAVHQRVRSQVGDVTLAELAKFNGSDPYRPLLLAVRGRVFDVTPGRAFYGPGAGYSVFAGREVARALAKVAVDEKECNDRWVGQLRVEMVRCHDGVSSHPPDTSRSPARPGPGPQAGRPQRGRVDVAARVGAHL